MTEQIFITSKYHLDNIHISEVFKNKNFYEIFKEESEDDYVYSMYRMSIKIKAYDTSSICHVDLKPGEQKYMVW